MKRMQSTETLGSTSAINSDKTGTLTLDQMTAVQMTVVGRRYTIDGAGYTGTGNPPASPDNLSSTWTSSCCRWCWPPTPSSATAS